MTRSEAHALADELAKQVSLALVLNRTSAGASTTTIASAIMDALNRAMTPSRLEAAERAVVESAVATRAALNAFHKPLANDFGRRPDWRDVERLIVADGDAIDRLVALREQLGKPQCEATDRIYIGPHAENRDGLSITVRCSMPIHDGPHFSTVGGEWRWT